MNTILLYKYWSIIKKIIWEEITHFFFENSSVYLRQDDFNNIVTTVSGRHAPPNHANTIVKDIDKICIYRQLLKC